MAVLDASRPRVLPLAKRDSSRAIFVGVLLILTSLFTIEIAQGAKPGAPTNLAGTAGDGQVSLTWTAPSNDGGSSITGYKYRARGSGFTFDTNWTSTGNTNTSYTVTGLANGKSYHFSVRAVNADGDGTVVTPHITRTPNIAAPTGLTATAGDGQVALSWTAPAGYTTITGYQYQKDTDAWASAGTSSPHTVTGLTNGTQYAFKVRAVGTGGGGTASTSVTVTPRLSPPTAPTGLTAVPGDGEVRLSWTAPASTITRYEYRQDSGTWQTTGSTATIYTITNLTNGTAYTFRVRGVNSAGNGAASSVTATPLRDAPGTPRTLNVERVEDTAILTWSPPSDTEEGIILRYEYSSDGGSTWKSTGSSETRYIVPGLEPGETYTFLIRGVYVDGGTSRIISFHSTSSNSAVLNYPKPKPNRRIIYECPVGWTRGSVFGRTKKVLIYELKVNVDRTDRISMYQLKSLAIYVHPDEGLETLEGWYLTTGILYNHDHENKLHLTAENSVIDEHGFAHIQNPEDTPIRMGTLGFIGQSLPSFDYRLYDERGLRVDFGISCYKEGGLTYRLWNTEDPRVLRVLPFPISEEALSVQMKELDWQTPFFRTQWTAAIMPDLPDAPAAPSLVKKNIVGTWGDLKKQ